MRRTLPKKLKNAVLRDASQGMLNREITAKHGISLGTVIRWKKDQRAKPKHSKSKSLMLELKTLKSENQKLRDLFMAIMLRLVETNNKQANGIFNSILRQLS